MNIREPLQSKPAIGIGIAVSAGLLGVLIVWLTLGGREPARSMAAQLYFTDDGGSTFFADDSAKIPPFDHQGKVAVQAVVFKCGSKAPFVGYLLRYAASGHDALMKLSEAERRGASPQVVQLRMNSAEVKRPDQKEWQLMQDEHSVGIGDIVRPHCPDGSSDEPTPVLP